MKKFLPVCALFAFFASVNSWAASNPYDCGAISDNERRLACYDGFFKNKSYDQNTVTPTKENDTHLSLNQKEQQFGSDRMKNNDNLTFLNSTLTGSFKDWKKGMILTLSNGQQWKITSDRYIRHSVSKPDITIEKGFLGAYYMSVEDLNYRFKVKRIK